MENEIGTPIQSLQTEAERLTNELFAKAFASIKTPGLPYQSQLTAEQIDQRKNWQEQFDYHAREMARIVTKYPWYRGEIVDSQTRWFPLFRRYQHNGRIIRIEISVDNIPTAPPLF